MLQMSARAFAALGDPTRLKMIGLLSQKACTSGELSSALVRSSGNVSRNLGILKTTGLVREFREGGASLNSLADSFAMDLIGNVLEQIRNQQTAMALAVG